VQALMGDPPVLILDEPTSGLDPLMIEAFCETIDDLARAGRTTIFLSSHVLSEVDRVCDRIALIRNGRLVAVRTLSELRAAAPRRVTVLFSLPVDASVVLAPGLVIVSREPQRWVIEARGPLGALIDELGRLPVADISMASLGLEEAILHLFEDRAC
jgi:ABC-2 type transport system ATP-binding protein